MAKQYKWHRIAASENELEWLPNGIAVVEVEEKQICITRWSNRWFGFANKCPHAGGPLESGYIDSAGHIVCPLHAYKFSLQTGRSRNEEGYQLRHWPIEQRTDGIYIGFEEKGFLNWLR